MTYREPAERIPDLVYTKPLTERVGAVARAFCGNVFVHLATLATLFMAACFGCDVAFTFKHNGLGVGFVLVALGLVCGVVARCIKEWI